MQALKRMVFLTTVAVVACSVLVGGIIACTSAYDAFSDKVAEDTKAKYAHLAGSANRWIRCAGQSTQAVDGMSRAKGKPVFVCMTNNDRRVFGGARTANEIDPLTARLSPQLFPESENEVRTVAALWWSQELMGSYDQWANGYRDSCHVRIIDIESGNLIAEKILHGGEPPQSITRNKRFNRQTSGPAEKVWGPSCEDDVLAYVESLVSR